MNAGATYRGWTYDEAAERKEDLDDAKTHLEKAIQSLSDADYPYDNLLDEIDYIRDVMTNMATIMADCKKKEDKANYRLGGDL
ncbi:MAG: hypothetical protein GX096_15315 [Clostridiales bacterium]|nr:hypothetical protein [Clostridiales bacterium]